MSSSEKEETKSKGTIYYCPMHPGYIQDKPGDCGICGMKLVKREDRREESQVDKTRQSRKILYYRNPMNPEVTSDVAMKDEMGMDYVPVYEESKGGSQAGVYISSEKQQLIGIKKEKVQRRILSLQIHTVGRVAYDPELYVAQQEYLQALKAKDSLEGSSIDLIKQQTKGLVEAAQRRLLLLGMGQDQIQALVQQGQPQQDLYLLVNQDKAWIYITIYEYEIGLIQKGLPVEIEAVAFPGQVFKGKVAAITPVLDPKTRSIQVRAEVEDLEHKLKPEMFVNVNIKIEIGERLAMPQEAVMDTGERQMVFVAKPEGYFESRQVRLGNKAGDYYEVIAGVNEGEEVVSSGNFFVDSESRLKSAIDTSTSLEY
jgi:multidrug efflux pump subunit AcrA (membrane-fusion protein)